MFQAAGLPGFCPRENSIAETIPRIAQSGSCRQQSGQREKSQAQSRRGCPEKEPLEDFGKFFGFA
jgi:hypothetical protein